MRKALLYRLYSIGKIPDHERPSPGEEGPVLSDEGLRCSVTFRNYESEGKRFLWKRRWFTGSLLITGKRFAAFAYSRRLISIPLQDQRIAKLDVNAEGDDTLSIAFSASDFQKDQSGKIEYCFRTNHARQFAGRLRKVFLESAL